MDVKTIIEKAGGARHVAEHFGISVAAVYAWDQVPLNRVPDLAKMTGLELCDIRGDVFEGPSK